MKAPAFQFYASDFLAGTADMEDAEVGAFIRLLCYQWERGSIPADPERIRRMVKGTDLTLVLEKFQKCEDGNLRNRRLEEVREEQATYKQSQAEKAKKRWKKDAGAYAQHMPEPCQAGGARHMPSTCPPSPSPIDINISTGAGAGEVMSETDALAQAANAGIEPDFAKYLYDTWAMRGGKDGAGIAVPFIKLAAKRWSREQAEWKAGTHNGNKKHTHGQKPHSTISRNTPEMSARANRYAIDA